MPEPRVTVVVPTLAADLTWVDCLRSLAAQTWRDVDVVIVDNSGTGTVKRSGAAAGATVLEPGRNVGFGAAVNLGWRHRPAPFLATLNDDAVADPRWLEELLAALHEDPRAGMAASQVRLAGGSAIDSAALLLGADGSSKQRGHGAPPDRFARREPALMPSGSAAMYRRQMLEETGGFEESFFLYCEDTDLGLRARWAGWDCVYVPSAVVEHRYSHSAGRASPLKAYLVERNRLFVAVRNFPGSLLWRAPFYTLARYGWHLVMLLRGQGRAGEFRQLGHAPWRLLWFVFRAHLALLGSLPRLLRQRSTIRRAARISPAEFARIVRLHSITAREVASQ